jgi:hypothetical protein
MSEESAVEIGSRFQAKERTSGISSLRDVFNQMET